MDAQKHFLWIISPLLAFFEPSNGFMNQFVVMVLIVFGLAWMAYLGGLRNKRIAFTLWFPLTATSFIATLVWLWAAFGLMTVPKNLGAAGGFAAMGMALILGALIAFPLLLAVSLWQRPKSGSYGLAQIVPVIILYLVLLISYRPLSHAIEDQKLEIVVVDVRMRPIAGVKIHFLTHQRSMNFSFPSPSVNGDLETDSDGVVTLSIPRTHEVDCDFRKEGYAFLQVRMDRAWRLSHSNLCPREIYIGWQFLPDDPNKPWEYHKGSVETDIEDASSMHLTVYLPQKRSDKIPLYGPLRIYQVENGKVSWTIQQPEVRTQ